MEEVKKAVLYTSSRRLSFVLSSILIGASLPLAFIIGQLNVSPWIFYLWIAAALLSRSFIQIILLKTRTPDNAFFSSKVYKELKELGYTDEFVNTVDEEIKNDIDVRLCEEKNQINLFITKTWFIYITTNESIIRKVSDISKIYTILRSNSKHAVCIEFTDGEFFSSEDYYDDIWEIFEKKFPDLITEPPED